MERSNSWRYERKFVVSHFNKYEIETILKLHMALFSEMYYERKVNSLYFDSFSMQSLFENESGDANRKKIRIRWYGDLFGLIETPTLEIKVKSGYVGNKTSYKIDQFVLDETLNIDIIARMIEESEIADVLKMKMLGLRYLIITSYWRKYFQSSDKRFRVTIDSDVEYIKLDSFGNTFLNRLVDKDRIILELKYDEAFDPYAESITNWFNFRLGKNSKYVKAIQNVYL